MMENGKLKNLLISIVTYFILIEILSWIGGKIFYDFDKVPILLFQDKFFKFFCMIIIVFLVYTFTAACVKEIGGKSALLIIGAILIVSEGIYDLATYDETIEIIVFIIEHGDDILKIISLLVVAVISD